MALMRFSGSVATASGTIANPALEIIPPPGKSIMVVSIVGTVPTATFSQFNVIRSLAAGINPTAVVLGQSLAEILTPSRPSQTQLAISWTTPPTIAGVPRYLGQLWIPGTIGASGAYRPSVPVAVGQSLLIWNLSATAVGTGFTIEWDEETT